MVLLTSFTNAEEVDLKLKCSGIHRYKNIEIGTSSSTDVNFYLTFSKNMQKLRGIYAICEVVKKNDEFYFCNDGGHRIEEMTLDRRILTYIENTRAESTRDKVKAKCEIAKEPKI